VELKEKELVNALQYHYKDEDIAHIVQEKKRFNKDRTKVAQRKIELNKLRVSCCYFEKIAEKPSFHLWFSYPWLFNKSSYIKEYAVQNNDFEKIKEIDFEIAELDEKSHDVDRKRSGNFSILAYVLRIGECLTC
jgi:hypothetical protein